MTKTGKKLAAVFLMVAMAITFMPVFGTQTVYAAEIIASGNISGNVYWKIDSDGTLTYYGNGEVTSSASSAWKEYYDSIDAVVIEDGITAFDTGFPGNCLPVNWTIEGHLTSFNLWHEANTPGDTRRNFYFLGDAPDYIYIYTSYFSYLTVWYDPDKSGWTRELIEQQNAKPIGLPKITRTTNWGFGEGSPDVTFSVTAEGKEPLYYQWYSRQHGSSVWTAVTEASGKTADYTFTPTQSLELYCQVSNHIGSTDSNVMELKKVITSQPMNKTVNEGEKVSFSVTASGLNGLSYQWYYLIPGNAEWIKIDENGDSDTYSLSADKSYNDWQFRCKVHGTIVDSEWAWQTYFAYSRAATLTVKEEVIPEIVNIPSGKTLTYNGKKQTGVSGGANYTITGNTATNAGSYTANLSLKDKTKCTWSDGTTADKEVKWTINKAVNPLAIKARTAAVKYKKLEKKNQTLTVTKVIKFTKKGQGKLTYKLVSAKKGKKSYKKYFKINTKTGKLTVKKNSKMKKGTYKVKVKVKAAGNANYMPSAWKTVTSKMKVK